MLSKLIVLLLALVSSLADAGVEIANIKFGVLRQTGSGTYAMDVETTRIPLRLQETGFRFGITFENPTGAKIDWYEIMHLPSPLKATSGTLQSIEPKLLRTEKKSTVSAP